MNINLTDGDIVPPPGTNHQADIPRVGLRAVAREPGAGHEAGHGRVA